MHLAHQYTCLLAIDFAWKKEKETKEKYEVRERLEGIDRLHTLTSDISPKNHMGLCGFHTQKRRVIAYTTENQIDPWIEYGKK